MWAAEDYKLHIGLVPGAEIYNLQHPGHPLQCGISSAESLAVGADDNCVFTVFSSLSAEMDAWALPSAE